MIKHAFMVFRYFETLKENIDRYKNNPNMFYYGCKSKRKFFCFAMSAKYAHGDGKKNNYFLYHDEDCMDDVML